MKDEIMSYIEQNESIEIPTLQNKFNLSYREAKAVIDELIAGGVLVFESGVIYKTVTKPADTDRNGLLVKASWIDSAEKQRAECRSYLEARRKELIMRMQALEHAKNHVDDTEDADEEDMDFLGTTDKNEDSDIENDEGKADLRPILIECLTQCLQDNSDEQKYILGLDGDLQVELNFVNDGSALRLSDGGQTLASSSQTNRKIKNVLKGFAPVILEGEEICITIENPYGTLMALLTLYSAIDAVKKMK